MSLSFNGLMFMLMITSQIDEGPYHVVGRRHDG